MAIDLAGQKRRYFVSRCHLVVQFGGANFYHATVGQPRNPACCILGVQNTYRHICSAEDPFNWMIQSPFRRRIS